MWSYSSRTFADKIRRAINDQKFYATLPHKIDNAVEEYLDADEVELESRWESWEELDGETPLGGAMGVSFVSHRTNTAKDSNSD